jgi:hypothetical protein
MALVMAAVGGLAVLPATASGAAWHSTPLAKSYFPPFEGVAASSTSNVWAVGENEEPIFTPYAEHWDGARWQDVHVPVLGPAASHPEGGLYGVAVRSRRNAWAVGWSDLGQPAMEVPMIEHWNGVRWRIVPCPRVGSYSSLSGVAVVTPKNVWAVGSFEETYPIAEHWNGSRWKLVRVPGAEGLGSMQVISARNIWAVGPVEIEHYNGKRWRLVSFPAPDGNVFLNQITRVPGTRHLWAVGWDGLPSTPVAFYYDGSHWVSRTPPGGIGTALYGVAARSASDVWAAGYGPGALGSYVVHWNGSAWKRVQGTALDGQFITGMTRAPRSSELWAVGIASTNHPLFAGYYR